MRFRLLLVTVVCMSLIGCSEKPAVSPETETSTAAAPAAPPSADAARSIIETSTEWSDYDFTETSWTAQPDPRLRNADSELVLADLVKDGWLKVGKGKVERGSRAEGDAHFVDRTDGSIDIVPLASKELVDSGTPQPAEEGRLTVNIEWKWNANPIGQSIRRGMLHERFTTPKSAIVTLMHDGTNWTVLSIKPRTAN